MNVFTGNIVISNFATFSSKVDEIFNKIKQSIPHTMGKNAD